MSTASHCNEVINVATFFSPAIASFLVVSLLPLLHKGACSIGLMSTFRPGSVKYCDIYYVLRVPVFSERNVPNDRKKSWRYVLRIVLKEMFWRWWCGVFTLRRIRNEVHPFFIFGWLNGFQRSKGQICSNWVKHVIKLLSIHHLSKCNIFRLLWLIVEFRS